MYRKSRLIRRSNESRTQYQPQSITQQHNLSYISTGSIFCSCGPQFDSLSLFICSISSLVLDLSRTYCDSRLRSGIRFCHPTIRSCWMSCLWELRRAAQGGESGSTFTGSESSVPILTFLDILLLTSDSCLALAASAFLRSMDGRSMRWAARKKDQDSPLPLALRLHLRERIVF